MFGISKKALTRLAICGFSAIALSTAVHSTAKADMGGTILGGAAGAAVGSTFGKGQGKLAAVAAGTILGALIGNSLGDTHATVSNTSGAYAPQRPGAGYHGPAKVHRPHARPKHRYPGKHYGHVHRHGHGHRHVHYHPAADRHIWR